MSAYDTLHSPAWEPLLEAAWAARARAHAPYSRFHVGAALAFGDGTVVGGCNVENAAYPLCTCAERVAMCAAVARGLTAPQALVVVTEAERLTPPCGACRQVLIEFADQLPILLANGKARALHHLADLLPEAFTPRDLGITMSVQSKAPSVD
ncbi:MAG TPA: cytidine deaminase [Holophagaceae bacterium]|nr:cytidine deaminase [Holophagaceae bacterium]